MPQPTPSRMPAVFLGHGSPMNVLEDNAYTRAWQQIAAGMPKPKSILSISAHWTTRGTHVTATEEPATIHDFGGFPQALFDIRYPAPGSPALASRVRELLAPVEVQADQSWGLDHGTWGLLVKMFPDADVPVVQLSIDATRPHRFHFEMGQRLAPLRDEGVLIMASGNVVHNLRMMNWNGGAAHDWAERFNNAVRDCLLSGDVERLADYPQWGPDAHLSVPTPEHFLPLLYILGARREGETVSIPVDGIELGAISMMSVIVGDGGAAGVAGAEEKKEFLGT
ncbi:MAG TPA: 4,5-DOPA dioxygenase extradiol [Noviherbaspirillum sp.]|uniref:4,5-DOPA-extradiol-dioxygenase n=1 Tax=Noviherbaspirillum sp. TaxID=1926288 RepID=UPI002B461F7F|nr:4,5-DOPA dioxygenase extradiol [Noviherbaspirillum sp.]HJV87383.1 4,5-DOPA dioxygenase extradiol [Noviherbaspirillum sp.]